MTITSKSDRDRIRQRTAEKRLAPQRRKDREMLKEMTAAKKAAFHFAERRVRPEDIEARIAEIPTDTRSLTGKLLGDPIINDPRCPWRPRLETRT